jgi:transposase
MAKARSLVGLDVHATTIVAAVLDAETGQLQTFGMSGDTDGAAGFCAGLPRPVRVAYEAGSTGYGLARELAKRMRSGFPAMRRRRCATWCVLVTRSGWI